MEDENGWIKIHRKILKWEWWDEPKTFVVFIYLLLEANYEPKKWKGILIERGQLITGLYSLSKNLKMSLRSIRTSLTRLKSTGEVTIKTTNRFSLITINNYEKYQLTDKPNDKPADKQTTNKRQQHKKEKKEKEEKKQYGKCVFLTNEEYQKLSDGLGGKLPALIEELDLYIQQVGDKYKSHYATILNWYRRKNPNERRPGESLKQWYDRIHG